MKEDELFFIFFSIHGDGDGGHDCGRDRDGDGDHDCGRDRGHGRDYDDLLLDLEVELPSSCFCQ